MTLMTIYCCFCGKQMGYDAPIQPDRCYMNCEGWDEWREEAEQISKEKQLERDMLREALAADPPDA